MNKKLYGPILLKEFDAEVDATLKCLARIPEKVYKFKPHEKSMEFGYLALIVAEIPKWITTIIEDGVIDFATWERFQLGTSADLLKYFESNVKGAREALKNVVDEDLEDMFILRSGEQELAKEVKKDSISSTLNHWVHHRGQMTVYMRLNDIPVPSIYGPSADDKAF